MQITWQYFKEILFLSYAINDYNSQFSGFLRLKALK